MATSRELRKQKNEFKRRKYRKGALGIVNRAVRFEKNFRAALEKSFTQPGAACSTGSDVSAA